MEIDYSSACIPKVIIQKALPGIKHLELPLNSHKRLDRAKLLQKYSEGQHIGGLKKLCRRNLQRKIKNSPLKLHMERNRKLLKKNQSKFVLKRGERILPKIFTPDMKKKTRKVSQRDRDLVSVSLDYNNEAQEHSQSFCNQYVAEKINSSFSTERGKNNVNISFTSFMQQSENLFKKRKVSRRPVKTPHLSFLKEFLSLNSRNKKGVGTTQTCKAVKSRPYKYRIVNPPECIQGSLTNKKISRREFPFHRSHADSVQTSHLTEVDHKNISFKGLFRYHKRI